MPDMHTRVSGTWKKVNELHVKVSGVWKAVQTGYIKVSGTWKEFYNALAYALSGESGIIGFQIQPNTAIAGVRVNADGTIDKITGNASSPTYTQIDAATDWVIPNGGATGAERFRCTDNNANLDFGTTGSWLTAGQQWYITHGTLPAKQLDIDIEISILGDTTTDDTGNYTGNASAEP
jgi:hypothetical protein